MGTGTLLKLPNMKTEYFNCHWPWPILEYSLSEKDKIFITLQLLDITGNKYWNRLAKYNMALLVRQHFIYSDYMGVSERPCNNLSVYLLYHH